MAKKNKNKKPDRSRPLPEAIDGERWNVFESPSKRLAGVTSQGRQMMVPMGVSTVERLMRMHEMTHVKITPRAEMGEAMNHLPESLLNYCEDARVHGHMMRLDFDVSGMVGVMSDFELDQLLKDHPSHLAAVSAGMYGTGEAARLSDKIEETEDTFLRGVFNYGATLALNRTWSGTETPGFETTLQMVRDIIDTFGDPRDPDESPEQQVPDAMLPLLAEETPEYQPGNIAPGDGPWKHMTIEEPPLTEKLPAEMKGRPKKKIDLRGRKLYRVGRLYQDGRVFSRKEKQRGGGAVLIDTSGSMSLTAPQVLRLMETFPAGIIASYSSSGDDGYLRVIARKGKRVPTDQLSTPGSGNGVDGPALDWIAKWPGPRYWISDAGVEGGAEGLRYCLDVCRKHDITRVDNAYQILNMEE